MSRSSSWSEPLRFQLYCATDSVMTCQTNRSSALPPSKPALSWHSRRYPRRPQARPFFHAQAPAPAFRWPGCPQRGRALCLDVLSVVSIISYLPANRKQRGRQPAPSLAHPPQAARLTVSQSTSQPVMSAARGSRHTRLLQSASRRRRGEPAHRSPRSGRGG